MATTTAKKKAPVRKTGKAARAADDQQMCCSCQIGMTVQILPVDQCAAQGGTCMGASFPCMGKDKPSAKKRAKK